MSKWFVYMVRCVDKSYYTGITTDLHRRVRQHNGKQAGGAKYTRSRRPVVLCYFIGCSDLSNAAKREHALKRLSHDHKRRYDNT